MENIEKMIGYHFKNKNLLRTALTHSSYANESREPGQSNERLEFLGDSVLSIVVSDYLYKNYEKMPEGELTKLRSTLVCEKTLCVFARNIKLGEALLLGKGEKQSGGARRASILADAFEALIAAVYMDSGLDSAREFVLSHVLPALANSAHNNFVDYKTTLQEIIQKNPEERLEYVLTGESGPDHDKRFCVEIHLNSNAIGRGEGQSKKEAEQRAAREALELMGQ